MKNLISVFLLLSYGILNVNAQSTIAWDVLADVQLEEKYDANLGINYYNASFGAAQAFESQEIILSGFIIPLDALGTQYVLSRNPQTSCFFCGGAGPESVVKLELKPRAIKRYQTDARLTFEGRLKLNSTTKEDLLYIMERAEEF